MTTAFRPRRWAAGATAILLCVGCAGATRDAGAPRSASDSPSPSSDHGAGHEHTTGVATEGDVRLRLEQILGHHAVLMVRLMRGPIDKEQNFVAAAQGALDRNTDELVEAVRQVYGPAAGTQFQALWEEHIEALRAYGEALADGDEDAKHRAMATLDAYPRRYGELITSATQGRLSADAVASGVDAHVHHMIDAAEAYADGDYQRAFEMERQAYAAMFTTAKSLAGAGVRKANGELPVAFDSPSENLRSGLGRLLGEHVELAFDATRAIVAGQPSAGAAAEALDANTQEILAAMQGAAGDQAAAAFGEVWAAHIDALVQFSVAVADDDDAAQSAARAHLDSFPARLSSLLSPLSQGDVAATTVVEALKTHDQQLLQQVTAYAAGDFATSHDLAYAGYDHMFAIAGTLADVVEGKAGASAPRGGAKTGAGGAYRR